MKEKKPRAPKPPKVDEFGDKIKRPLKPVDLSKSFEKKADYGRALRRVDQILADIADESKQEDQLEWERLLFRIHEYEQNHRSDIEADRVRAFYRAQDRQNWLKEGK
jgi:hypothetical protein